MITQGNCENDRKNIETRAVLEFPILVFL